MSNLTIDYDNWGTTLNLYNPIVWILIVIIAFIIAAILVYVFKIEKWDVNLVKRIWKILDKLLNSLD